MSEGDDRENINQEFQDFLKKNKIDTSSLKGTKEESLLNV